MSVTVSDVAKRAGVSPATVSKYLNKKRISPQSYSRIEEAICELHYQVNDFARGLRSNVSKMIGLLVPSIDYTFATALFKEVQERLTQYDYASLLYNYNYSGSAFIEKILLVCQRRVDGVIILISGETNELIRQGLQELQAAKIPFVLVNGAVDGIEADTVLADNAQAFYTSTTHLLENGHRKIGLIMAQRNSSNAKDRVSGFRKAYEEAGLTVDEQLIFYFENRGSWYEGAEEKLFGFIQSHPEMTALIFPSMSMTVLGIQTLHRLGRKIGEDIALVGFDLDMIKGALESRITYMRLPAKEISVNAVAMLLDAIKCKEKKEPQILRIPAQEIEGNSIFKI